MLSTRITLMCLCMGAMFLLSESCVHAQSKTQNIQLLAPVTVRTNTNVAFTATVSNTWDNTRIASRMVTFSVGDQFYLTNAGAYPTNTTGVATFNWRFTRPGKYRVVANIPDGSGYLSQRTTLIVNVQ